MKKYNYRNEEERETETPSPSCSQILRGNDGGWFSKRSSLLWEETEEEGARVKPGESRI